MPQVVRGIVARTTTVHTPVKDVRVVIDAPGQEPKPFVKAVVVRAASLSQTQVPLAVHRRPVAQLFQSRGQGRYTRWEAARCAMPGQDGAHPRIAGIASRQ